MKQGDIIGLKYRILKKIGRGGNSSVFLAENLLLSNLWAVKAIDRSMPSAVDEMQEVNILKSLNHPMLPRIADLCEDDKYIYIIMDYIEGETLSEVVGKRGRIEEGILAGWARQLCDVLIYLHSRHPPIIYRDLKPSNIILDSYGRLHLVDFGTAKPFREQNLEDTVYIGTQGYAAPEQFGLGRSDERTDLYNLGMTLFHLATGIHPAGIDHDDIERHLKQCGISKGFSSIIRDLTRREPSERIADARTCLELLNRIDGQKSFREEPVRGVFVGRLIIGVSGVVHGCGATFVALCLANCLAAMGHKTAVVDHCGNGDLARLEAVMDRNNRLTQADDISFVADGITYFRNAAALAGCPRGFNRIVGDFGYLWEQRSVAEFARSDVRIVVCPASDWKFPLVQDFMARMAPYDPNREWIYVFPNLGQDDKRQIRKTLQTNHILAFPHVSNPFHQSRNEQKNIQEFLNEAVKMSGIQYAAR